MAQTWVNYSKDSDWVLLSPSADFRVKFDEAIVRKPNDDTLVVYALVTEGKELSQNKNNKEESGKEHKLPALCYFKVPLREYETTYQGKTKKYEQSKAQKIIAEQLLAIGLDVPFSGLIDWDIKGDLADSIISGKQPDGNELSADTVKFILSSYLVLNPIEKLSKIDLATIPTTGSNGKGGYARATPLQKESEKLEERYQFIANGLKEFNEGKELANFQECVLLLNGLDDKMRSAVITLLNTIIK